MPKSRCQIIEVRPVVKNTGLFNEVGLSIEPPRRRGECREDAGFMAFPSRSYYAADVVGVLVDDATDFATAYVAMDELQDKLDGIRVDLATVRGHRGATNATRAYELQRLANYLSGRVNALRADMQQSIPAEVWNRLPDYVTGVEKKAKRRRKVAAKV